VRDAAPRRLGLIVNPYAGRGGPLAHHGSDDLAPSGPPPAAVRDRTLRALRRIARAELHAPLEIHAAPGPMGADLARAAGLTVTAELAPAQASTAAATRRCARAATGLPVDLLLFVGGDGTARDVTGATGVDVPVLGVPAGVKMHSGVFGATPESAGDVAADFLHDPQPEYLAPAEVLDIDEPARRAGQLGTRLYGDAMVPDSPSRVLAAKSAAPSADEARLAAACAAVAAQIDDHALTQIGPGTTTRGVLAARGQHGSLLGVDVLADGRVLGRNLDEAGLLALLEAGDRPVALVLGVVGGQGMLLGRGNQQLSAAVLRRVPCAAITVLAARDKLLALHPARLCVDTGDPELDQRLHGHLPVQVATRERIMMEVGG
jgi:predicted polyphosphate/ATP-dependent NAD kinase